MSDEPLAPEDIACLRMLAGASFLGGEVTLPSGRVLTPDEMQAFTSAYAPAVETAGEPKVWVHPIHWKVLPTYAEPERHMSWWRKYIPRWGRR